MCSCAYCALSLCQLELGVHWLCDHYGGVIGHAVGSCIVALEFISKPEERRGQMVVRSCLIWDNNQHTVVVFLRIPAVRSAASQVLHRTVVDRK